ncbi:MAG TPA: hypothetical protein VFH31_06390 [Pyrinomonadaceae bacterium]|nr:hypothetical protein [Pyrinomonadaceae bacterium]
MANLAHGNGGRNELAQVAAGASLVTGETRRGGIIRALMARSTSQRCMALARMQEF